MKESTAKPTMLTRVQSESLNLMNNRYPVARSLNRHHHFYVGPTNSGKTFQAIKALIDAKSGVYLAPLRLLAMEVRDKLMQAGVPCNLITGEERDMVDGAKHTSSTIEMMNPAIEIAVAVIDEIQMLQDRDRGSAWTAALIGVPARQVYVCGSNAVTDLCSRVIESLSETFDMTQCARMTPLVLETDSVCGPIYSKLKVRDQLRKGDAVIAFSRKDVLTLSARFRQWGFSVASIYGALSPEVRRHESNRFSGGLADVLVATDAIGMGLNLPIRRVIFASTAKFDGITHRPLNATEVRQIAGRAGRFGIYDTGYVNVLEDHERFHIERMLNADDTSSLQQLPVKVDLDAVLESAARLRTTKLSRCLESLEEQPAHKNGLFNAASVNAQLAQAMLIDLHAPDLSLQDKYTLACAPISIDANFETNYFLQCLKSVREKGTQRLPPRSLWLLSKVTKQPNPKYLEDAEALSQNLSLYAWLSHQFPQVFIEGGLVKVMRAEVSHYIAGALLTQAGYVETTRESNSIPVWRKRR
jgi:ATP-dependent RNA helicase SUPV3L1/SUV3